MESALFIARLILAVLLVAAAAAKLVDRDRFRKSLRDFGVTPRWVNTLSGIVPLSELLAAALLLLPQTIIPGALLTFVLLLVFTTAISYNLVLGREPECNCFGQIGSSTISARTLLRNGLLALVASALVVDSPSSVSPDRRLLLLIVLTLAAIAATLFVLVYEVAHRQEDLGRQIDDLQEFLEGGSFSAGATGAAKPPPRELPVGAPAPSFQLFALDGRQVTLADVLSSGQSAVAFFMSAECAPCSSLFPEINLWRHELGRRFNFVVVSKGDAASNRAKFANARLDPSIPILADEDGAVAREYRVKWTPGAVLIGAHGVIASQLAFGDKQIRSLLEHVTFSPETKPWFSSPQSDIEGNGNVPQVGDPSPVLAISDARGIEMSLAKGAKTMLLFWGPNCGFCKEMLDDLRTWEKTRSQEAPQLLVVSRGDAETHEELHIEAPVVFDHDLRISRAFGTPGTPSAIIIDGEGRVASALGAGAEEVLALAGYRRNVGND